MFRLMKKYPEQAVLLLFNAGVFGYLQNLNHQVANLTGFSATDLSAHLPDWLINLVGNSYEQVSAFMASSAWSWLVISVILTLLIRFVKGVIKFVLFLLILAGGFYLIWQNQELIRQFI